MKEDLINRIKPILFILLGLLIFAITAFIFQFWDTSFSNDTKHWSEFGDYIGGVINTIISLTSLIVLGFLTYYVAYYSSKENKKLQLYYKRLEIYDLSCDWMINGEGYVNRIEALVSLYENSKIDIENKSNFDMILDSLTKVEGVLVFVKNLQRKYHHFFKETFNTDEYKTLTEANESYLDNLSHIRKALINNSIIIKDFDKKIKHNASFQTFLEKMNIEIESMAIETDKIF